MRITESGLRRIIRQEVRSLRENQTQLSAPGPEAMLQVPGISEYADARITTVYGFLGMLRKLAPPAVQFLPGYSKENDTLTVRGTRSDLEQFALKLDDELIGGAQSITDGANFVNGIVDI